MHCRRTDNMLSDKAMFPTEYVSLEISWISYSLKILVVNIETSKICAIYILMFKTLMLHLFKDVQLF